MVTPCVLQQGRDLAVSAVMQQSFLATVTYTLQVRNNLCSLHRNTIGVSYWCWCVVGRAYGGRAKGHAGDLDRRPGRRPHPAPDRARQPSVQRRPPTYPGLTRERPPHQHGGNVRGAGISFFWGGISFFSGGTLTFVLTFFAGTRASSARPAAPRDGPGTVAGCAKGGN